MAFRFQKRVKLLPGITANLSKSGISISAGVKGARITKGMGQTRATVGLTGSGLSHTEVVRTAAADRAALEQQQTAPTAARPRETKSKLRSVMFSIGRALGRIMR